ncbi:MAG TPA: alpha/beta fold hydrolase [Actinoplanes sp.]|nr:alpha/beta fold hydrolase [Actinoplanes sp.]
MTAQPTAPATATADPTSEAVTIPVALADGGPVEHEVHAELFRPDGPLPRTVQLLVPGFTYDHRYWTVPGPYHYAAAMVRAGWAVLALDRIGTGASSRPPAREVTADSNTAVLHQVVQALRTGAAGLPAFERVVTVGHSYGAGIVLMEAARHHDVAGAVVTGMLHTQAPLHARARQMFHQAADDPQLGSGDYPVDYATHLPGKRATLLEAPGGVDPDVSAYNERIKSTATIGEGDTLAQTYDPALSRAVDVPTLVVVGEKDQLFSAGEDGRPEIEPALDRERACFAPAAELEIAVVAGSGHALTIHRTASDFFEVVREWADRRLGGPSGA